MVDEYAERAKYGPKFIGPLNPEQAKNAEKIGEFRVRFNLYRYFILCEENF